MSPRRVVVAGIGNLMRHDDAVGPLVARRVAERFEGAAGADAASPGKDLDVAFASPLGEPLELLGKWDGADLAVVVDAVRSGAPAGTVTLDWLGPGGLEAVAGDRRSPSTHGLGVADVFRLASTLGQAPARVALVGVEGADFSFGEGLSAPVAAGLREAVELAIAVSSGQVEDGRRDSGYPGMP